MSKWRVLACALICTVLTGPAEAQTACTPVTTADPAVGVVFGRAALTWVQVDHLATDAGKNPVIVDYLGEVRQQGQQAVVTNFTIPKTSVTSITASGVPADCVSTPLPAMKGLLATGMYTVTVTARGSSKSTVSTNQSNPFFLPASEVAPAGPANLRVVP